jgi:hypothetical protein
MRVGRPGCRRRAGGLVASGWDGQGKEMGKREDEEGGWVT